MLRNYFLINVILLIIIAFLGFKFYRVWVVPQYIPEEEVQRKLQLGEKGIRQKPAGRKQKQLDKASYNVIVQKDLFHPLRTENKEEDSPSETANGGKPQLFGTIIMDGEKGAILEDPATKISKLYRLKDIVAGYIVEDIQEDKVVLSSRGKSIEVRLRDVKAFKAPRRQPPTVSPKRPTRKTPPRRSVPKRPARERRSVTPPQSNPITPSPEATGVKKDLSVQDAGQKR